jgi:hypothetical protein
MAALCPEIESEEKMKSRQLTWPKTFIGRFIGNMMSESRQLQWRKKAVSPRIILFVPG